MNQSSAVGWHKYLPQHSLSRLVGWFSNRQFGWLTRWVIKKFIHHFQVDMSEAAEADYQRYPTFNAFFTRQLKPGARVVVADAAALASPVDGFVSEFGELRGETLLQAKGKTYSVLSLLGGDSELARQFEDGAFLTAYLAPKNYHRIHMPIEGKLLKMLHVPGRLFSVNQASVQGVDQLFARNERVVCLFDTKVGPMALVLVGAMLVGSIETVWHGSVTPPTEQHLCEWDYNEGKIILSRGQEMGHFKMGSTVITLFPKNTIQWATHLAPDSVLHYGEGIGQISLGETQ